MSSAAALRRTKILVIGMLCTILTLLPFWATLRGAAQAHAQTFGLTITADQSVYTYGQTVTLCYTGTSGLELNITNTLPDGTVEQLYSGISQGDGCLTGQAGPPAGQRHVHLVVTCPPGGPGQVSCYFEGEADTYYSVVAGNQSSPSASPPTIESDQPEYQYGQTVTVCYTASENGNVVITNTLPDGTVNELYSGPSQGSGCFSGQAGPPAGQRHLKIVWTCPTPPPGQVACDLAEEADAYYTVVAGSQSAPTNPNPPAPSPTSTPTLMPTNTPTPSPTSTPTATSIPLELEVTSVRWIKSGQPVTSDPPRVSKQRMGKWVVLAVYFIASGPASTPYTCSVTISKKGETLDHKSFAGTLAAGNQAYTCHEKWKLSKTGTYKGEISVVLGTDMQTGSADISVTPNKNP